MAAVAKPARHSVMQMQIFLVYRPYKESISDEMNNDNDLNLHSMTGFATELQLIEVCCKLQVGYPKASLCADLNQND